MSDLHVVPKPGHPPEYRAVAEEMSPELKEAFLNASLTARISEDDVIHAVLYFQAELLNSGFDCQKQMLKGMIENFLPARQADKKRLTEVIQQNTAVLRQVSEGLLQDYKALHELPDKVTQELRSLSEH
jgi:BioD-like phosphotransacetylase family protein